MFISEPNREKRKKITNKKSDLLNAEKINSLGYLVAVIDGSEYDLESVDVETGLCRVVVCGKIGPADWRLIDTIKDGDDNHHDPDDFYLENEDNQG